jgi:transposase
MSKTTNKFSAEVRARAVRMVFDHEGEYSSRWAAFSSIAAKIGCTAQTLNEWVKRAEVDDGSQPGIPSEVAEKMKALERENRELRQANEKRALEERIEHPDVEIARAREDEDARRLMTNPGIGPVTTTALVALAPSAATFRKRGATLPLGLA